MKEKKNAVVSAKAGQKPGPMTTDGGELSDHRPRLVMAGLVPAIHVERRTGDDVDARD